MDNVQKAEVIEQKAPEAESKEPKKGNPVTGYFKGAYEEMRKVSWPTRQETWRKAWIVIGFSVAFAIFLGAMDYLLNKVVETLL